MMSHAVQVKDINKLYENNFALSEEENRRPDEGVSLQRKKPKVGNCISVRLYSGVLYMQHPWGASHVAIQALYNWPARARHQGTGLLTNHEHQGTQAVPNVVICLYQLFPKMIRDRRQ